MKMLLETDFQTQNFTWFVQGKTIQLQALGKVYDSLYDNEITMIRHL